MSAYGGVETEVITGLTGEDLSGSQFLALTVADGDSEFEKADATTEKIVGIQQSVPGSGAGKMVAVLTKGVCLAKAGGSVTRGARVMVDTGDEGKLLDATGSSATVETAGVALASASDGDLFLLLVDPQSVYYA